MQDEPVVSVAPLIARHEFGDVVFNTPRRRSERETEAVRNAEDVRVDGERRLLKSDRHHDVRSLAADTRQRFERLSFARH